MVVGKDIYS